jgi:hypothetical protein
MNVGLVEELPANSLSGAAFEKHVVRDDNGRAAVLLEDGEDVLQEVELLVARRSPEVVAYNDQAFLLLVTLFVDHRDAAFFPKWRIGHDHLEVLAGMSRQAVCDVDGAFGATRVVGRVP